MIPSSFWCFWGFTRTIWWWIKSYNHHIQTFNNIFFQFHIISHINPCYLKGLKRRRGWTYGLLKVRLWWPVPQPCLHGASTVACVWPRKMTRGLAKTMKFRPVTMIYIDIIYIYIHIHILYIHIYIYTHSFHYISICLCRRQRWIYDDYQKVREHVISYVEGLGLAQPGALEARSVWTIFGSLETDLNQQQWGIECFRLLSLRFDQ